MCDVSQREDMEASEIRATFDEEQEAPEAVVKGEHIRLEWAEDDSPTSLRLLEHFMGDEFLSQAEVCALLGIQESYWYTYTKLKHPDFPKKYKIGALFFIKKSELIEWIKNEMKAQKEKLKD